MPRISIEVQGLNRLKRAFRDFPDGVRSELLPALSLAGQLVRGAAIRHIRKSGISGATGKLQQSIAVAIDKEKLTASVGPRLRLAPYAAHIELGRAPAGELAGKGPPTMIGSRVNRPFLRWANVKLGANFSLDEKGARDAYPLARSIRLRGHKAKPYMAPAALAAGPKVVRVIESAVDRAIARFGRG